MNYEQMSDFEINKAVAEALNLTVCDEQYLHYGDRDERVVLVEIVKGGSVEGKDYCNNPSDAWPMIVENQIHIIPRFYYCPRTKDDWHCHRNGHSATDVNPLRAAMIVFLKMKEGES